MWTRRRTLTGLVWVAGGALTGCGERSAAASTANWPSLIDALPARIQAEVRAGRYAGDLSHALRDAIETGKNFVIPPGVFPFAGGVLELRTPGQRIVGTGGLLRRLPARDGIGLLVSAEHVGLERLHLDGGAAATLPSHHNDMVKVTGDRCTIDQLHVIGSQGSNLRIDRAKYCTVTNAVLTKAFQNNIIICNGGTEHVHIFKPYCDTTKTQNNIYVTASEGGVENGENVSDIIIEYAICMNSADTGIEIGYHCNDSKVLGGRIINSTNPALLQRDGRRNLWRDVIVQNKAIHEQHDSYDGVAVVPQWEPASWDSATRFEGIIVQGPARRSAFYWGQSGIERINCVSDAYASGISSQQNGKERFGSGDMKAGDVSHIVVRGGRIDGFLVGDNWNFDGQPYRRVECTTSGITIQRCARVINCYNIMPIRCAIVDNRGGGHLEEELVLVRARLIPDQAHPDVGLLYDGNVFTPVAGRPPLAILLSDGVTSAAAVLLSRNSRFIAVPARGEVRVAINGQAGQAYRLTGAGGAIDFSIDAGTGQPTGVQDRRSPATEGAGLVQVAVEKQTLILHQRSPSKEPLWIRISGPGMKAFQIV